ncbi:MAG: hypothetical protein HYX84_02630, partial [Chloroflexi bacterium]|nr:hypothetical protein [Chloroflexota bacterium]
ALTRSGTALTIYVNGVSKDTKTLSGSTTNAGALTLGVWSAYQAYFSGDIDEVRISGVGRSADWIKASVMSENQTFISYGYTERRDMPKYLGWGWEQKYRGFGEVTETDADGNYAKHAYYTTGNIGGKDAERLTGREYQTKWYSSGGTVLRQKAYDWTWESTNTSYKVYSAWNSEGSGSGFIGYSEGIAASNDGHVYVSDKVQDNVQKFDEHGNFILKWGGYGTDNGAFKDPGGIAVAANGDVYVADTANHRIQKFDSSGNFLLKWGTYGSDNSTSNVTFSSPRDVAVSSNSTVYVADTGNDRIQAFNSSGTFLARWYESDTDGSSFRNPTGVAVGPDGYVYVADNGSNHHYVKKFTSDGVYITKWGGTSIFSDEPLDVAVSPSNYIYAAHDLPEKVKEYDASGATGNFWRTGWFGGPYGFAMAVGASVDSLYVFVDFGDEVRQFKRNWAIELASSNETIGSKTSQTRYVYDSYGNVITQYVDGDISDNTDNATIHRLYSANTTANILGKPARERVYAGTIALDDGNSNLKSESVYYYDGATSSNTSPVKGNLTRLQQSQNATANVSSYFTYDGYGNMLSATDPSGNSTNWTYDATYNTYPQTKMLSISGLSENYTYDTGTANLLGVTDINGQTTNYYYDALKRLTQVVKPGDSLSSPSANVSYPYWGTANQQHVRTDTRIATGNYSWQKQYFDGLGRIIQVQSVGEPATGSDNRTIISSTSVYSTRGLVDRQYVSQDPLSSNVSGYRAPDANWKYASYLYDGLGRVTTRFNADGTNVTYDYSTPWQTTVTNERSYKKNSLFDAFARLVKVEELDASHALYAATTYEYDVLGNLKQVTDNASNTTNMTYNWLSRKLTMQDPDMGSWSYGYDASGNTVNQTDAKGQVITFTYDALNRLTGKSYSSANMTNVTYAYDNVTDGGPYAKGLRTSMIDALFVTRYRYDERGRLTSENRTLISDNSSYVTGFGYDSADRNAWITYPTGENVTQTYNGRGLPDTLSGTTVGNLVTSTLYNQLGQVTQIALGNTVNQTYSYWGIDYGTLSYGRLYEIKAEKPGLVLQQVTHTWDNGGNLVERARTYPEPSETETFTYDFLDRLKTVSGAYSDNWTYSALGNINTHNSTSYGYGTKPHAVTTVGATSYTYDANGNMLTRGSDNITWDADNRPVTIKNIPSGTISRWKLDEGQGSTANDTVGGNNGTIYGATWSGNALSFDGTNDYVDIGDDSSLRAGQQFTLEAWVKGSYTKTSNVILTRWAGTKHSYIFRVMGASKALEMKIYSDDNNDHNLVATSTSTLSDSGRWYHVAVVVDTVNQTGNNRIKLYVDGQAVSANYGGGGFSGSVSWTAGVNTQIGGDPDLTYYFDGSVSDARLYGRALTAAEILSRYSSGRLDTTFVYDGDGNRVKKTEGGETILYVNKYFEKTLTTSENTTSYYHGGRLVAQREGTTLRYVHQDHLTGISVTSDSVGASLGSISYTAFGDRRISQGNLGTDKLFTGHRLDSTGLYYFRKPSVGPGNPNPSVIANSPLTLTGLWSGRYYDPAIGRFISPDTIVPDFANPQSFNRYSYVSNNPLTYTDEDGQCGWPCWVIISTVAVGVAEWVGALNEILLLFKPIYDEIRSVIESTPPVDTDKTTPPAPYPPSTPESVPPPEEPISLPLEPTHRSPSSDRVIATQPVEEPISEPAYPTIGPSPPEPEPYYPNWWDDPYFGM